MDLESLLQAKKAFVFGLDDVVYPKKDYQLQLYYLFSAFMEYTTQQDAKVLLDFMQHTYLKDGEEHVFEKAAAAFNIEAKYKVNFDRLYETAKLPLKLLLYQQVLDFMQQIVTERKAIFLLLDGNPAIQLNKIRQIEWHGLDVYLKVYFKQEIAPFSTAQAIDYIRKEHQLEHTDLVYIGSGKEMHDLVPEADPEFLPVHKLM